MIGNKKIWEAEEKKNSKENSLLNNEAFLNPAFFEFP
jgi:hypothetical protein